MKPAHSQTRDRSKFLSVRTILETPILDDRKWAKARDLECDILFVDLEDSVPEDRKEEGRNRAAAILRERSSYARPLLARVNNLSTPHGEADIAALASAGVEAVAYPKLDSVAELEQVAALFRAQGCDPDIFATIESMDGLRAVFDIAGHQQVCGIMFGPNDLVVDMGLPLGIEELVERDTLAYARSRIVLAAAQQKIACITMAVTSDLRDLEALRDEAGYLRRIGFSGLLTFYPPHLPVISALYTPSSEDVKRASETIALYETAKAEGRPAAQHHGRAILIHDYDRAKAVIERARGYGVIARPRVTRTFVEGTNGGPQMREQLHAQEGKEDECG